MTMSNIKEQLSSQIKSLLPEGLTPKQTQETTGKLMLYLVNLLIFERQVINEVLQTPGDSSWEKVKEEILKDKALWNQ